MKNTCYGYYNTTLVTSTKHQYVTSNLNFHSENDNASKYSSLLHLHRDNSLYFSHHHAFAEIIGVIIPLVNLS